MQIFTHKKTGEIIHQVGLHDYDVPTFEVDCYQHGTGIFSGIIKKLFTFKKTFGNPEDYEKVDNQLEIR